MTTWSGVGVSVGLRIRSGEVSLPAYELFSSAEVLSQMAMERMLAKLFTRGYAMASQSTRPG